MSLDADVRHHLREGFSHADIRSLLSSRYDVAALDRALAGFAEPAAVEKHMGAQHLLIALVLVAGGMRALSTAIMAAKHGAPPVIFAVLLVAALVVPSLLAWMIWTTRFHGYVATAVLVTVGAGRSIGGLFSGETNAALVAIDIGFALALGVPAFYLAKTLFPHRARRSDARPASSP